MLVDAPRIAREIVAGVDQGKDARDEEQEIQRQIERGLGARTHVAVEEIAAHMPVLRKRVRPAHHEQRPVQHAVEIENPGRRRVKHVALEHFDRYDEHQHDDQPGADLA